MYQRYSFRTYPSRVAFFLEALGDRPLALLDVGNLGDDGVWCARVRAHVEERGGTYTGLDSNPEFPASLRPPRQFTGTAEAMPVPDASFDAVYLGEILEHTWTPAAIIQECYRVLRPGGKLILDTPNTFSIVRILRFLLLRQDWMGDVRFQTYQEARDRFESMRHGAHGNLQPQHKIFYSPAMLRQILEMHGFVLESMGVTSKPKYFFRWLLLKIFPQTGSSLCVIARKASVEEAFADVRGEPAGS